jgi:hypothetical protein
VALGCRSGPTAPRVSPCGFDRSLRRTAEIGLLSIGPPGRHRAPPAPPWPGQAVWLVKPGRGLSVEVIGARQQAPGHSRSTLPDHDHGAMHDWVLDQRITRWPCCVRGRLRATRCRWRSLTAAIPRRSPGRSRGNPRKKRGLAQASLAHASLECRPVCVEVACVAGGWGGNHRGCRRSNRRRREGDRAAGARSPAWCCAWLSWCWAAGWPRRR